MTACSLLLGVLSLACDGTFCDEHPEACVAAVGGAGAGGAPAGPFEVGVLLLDLHGEAIIGAPLLVSTPDGQVLERVDTDNEARIVTAPAGGYISVFQTVEGRNYAFTAEVAAAGPALTFRMPVAKPVGPLTDITVSVDCTTSCEQVELSGSCFDPIPATPGNPLTFELVDYADCSADGDGIDLFAIGYSSLGLVEVASVKQAGINSMVSMFAPVIVPVANITNFTLAIEGDLGSIVVSRAVRVPYLDGRGFGYSRFREGGSMNQSLPMVKANVPHADTLFFVSFPDGRKLFRQEWFEAVESSVTSTFVLSTLATPSVPSAPEESGSSPPTASYALDEGPLGDAVQLRVVDSNVEWTVTLPPASEGSFQFPELPDDLASFKLVDIEEYDVMAVDRDSVESYQGFIGQTIYSHARRHGLESVTVATSTFP